MSNTVDSNIHDWYNITVVLYTNINMLSIFSIRPIYLLRIKRLVKHNMIINSLYEVEHTRDKTMRNCDRHEMCKSKVCRHFCHFDIQNI